MPADVFDYVIVGGGSAGSVLAGRLAEAGSEVIVLEAGGTDRRPDVALPAGVISVYKTANWRYAPEPDPSRYRLAEAWPAGRILGGGGSINATVFVRGNRMDFDSWEAAGATGWGYSSVLPYFKRMERWHGEVSDLRGRSGPIEVGEHTMHHPANDAFYEAALQAGHSANPDYNGHRQDGVGKIQVNQGGGVRSSASRRYLRGSVDGKPPTLRLHSLACRILFEGKRAVGVEYRRRGRTYRVHAREEVILSAGTLASPRLLMLSGVGARDVMGEHGVDLHTELPGVGENLQEHPAIMQRWHTDEPTLNTLNLWKGLGAVVEFVRHRTGLLTATVFHVQVMHKTSPGLKVPDIQLAFANFATTREVDRKGTMKVQPSRDAGFLVATTFLHPRARGRISLRSASPIDPPMIRHTLFGEPEDLRDLTVGMAEGRRIMSHDPIAGQVKGMFVPESRCFDDTDWRQYTLRNATYGAHPVGTCKMGNDDLAVVDPELRVHGVTGLRVVDASVMPSSPSGNTNAPTMMIAEKAADLILGRVSLQVTEFGAN